MTIWKICLGFIRHRDVGVSCFLQYKIGIFALKYTRFWSCDLEIPALPFGRQQTREAAAVVEIGLEEEQLECKVMNVLKFQCILLINIQFLQNKLYQN